jgi:uncharacterized surface protein with fasciclin (FAS1) repeats
LIAKAAKWSAKKLRAQVAAPLPNLLQLAQSVPQLSTLVAAVTAAGIGSVLAGPGPLTVFAPSNQAFAQLPADFLNYLLKPANKAALIDILTYHVAPGNYSSGDLHDREDIMTAEGKNVTIFKDQRGQIFVNFARVIAPNNEASNGVAVSTKLLHYTQNV